MTKQDYDFDQTFNANFLDTQCYGHILGQDQSIEV